MAVSLQSCAIPVLTVKPAPEPKPLFVIKVDRSKTLQPSASGDKGLDKFFADEIEQPGLSRERFDQLLADAIVKFDPGQSVVEIKDHDIKLKADDKITVDFFTENAWAECKDIPAERKKSLRPYLFIAKETCSNGGKDKKSMNDIVPLIRSHELVDVAKSLQQKEKSVRANTLDLAWHPIAPGIICVYAFDSPNNLSMIPAAEAAKMGLTATDMKKGPMRNLLSHLPTDIRVYGGNGLFVPSCGGDFESSLILDDRFMGEIKRRVSGRLVFGVSNKDVLVLAGDDDKASLKKMRQLVDQGVQQGSRPISDKLYCWDDGKVFLYQ